MGTSKSKEKVSTPSSVKKSPVVVNTASASNRISAADRATLQLKLQRDKLNVVMKRSYNALEREQQQALEFLSKGDRTRALYCLKKKKLQEVQLEQVTKMLENIQHSLDTIEFAKVEVEVVASLKSGTELLNVLQKDLGAQEVERVMEAAFDAVAASKEVSELLAQATSSAEAEWDDEDLLAELTEERGTKVQAKSGKTLNLPQLPTLQLPQNIDEKQTEPNRERALATA